VKKIAKDVTLHVEFRKVRLNDSEGLSPYRKENYFCITEIGWLTLFEEIPFVCADIHTKHINTECSFTHC
jgi:hypothetical protein